MSQNKINNLNDSIKTPPKGFAVLLLLGPSLIWCAEYIGSGEVIIATRTGAILGTTILWAVVVGVFLKFWIGMSGARYTVCTGEGMIDMFARIPGPRHWVVWTVLVVQFVLAITSMGAIATAAGAFISHLIPIKQHIAGTFVAFFALGVAWSGLFDVLKIVMSLMIFFVIIGVVYVAVHVFPPFAELLSGLTFKVPQVPEWALSVKGVSKDPWKEILALLGWGAGGFASQVWYTYWVLGAGYGAAAGRGYGKPADLPALKNMNTDAAHKIKAWCRVLYLDATFALFIGVFVTAAFLIAGAGILRPAQQVPNGPDVALTLSSLFSTKWGQIGATLFILSGSAALVSTLVGQTSGWPRMLADAFRICIPALGRKFTWKTQFRFLLLFFLCTNIIIVFYMENKPVWLIHFSAILEGILLTALQALWVGVGLYVVMPKLLSPQAYAILKPSWIFAAGLIVAFLVFGYFCVFHIPGAIIEMINELKAVPLTPPG